MNIKYDKNDPLLFGKLLKALRTERGFSQTMVAEHLEVDRSTYTKYELGRLPDIAALAKLSSLYGISADSMISVFFPPEKDDKFSRTAELGSDDNDARICILTKEERLVVEYFRSSLRKTAILNAIQHSGVPEEELFESSEQDT